MPILVGKALKSATHSYTVRVSLVKILRCWQGACGMTSGAVVHLQKRCQASCYLDLQRTAVQRHCQMFTNYSAPPPSRAHLLFIFFLVPCAVRFLSSLIFIPFMLRLNSSLRISTFL